VDPKNGRTLWEAEVGGKIVYQPVVVKGCVYVATDDGQVICLRTRDWTADGWTMWGGSARHNGPEERKSARRRSGRVRRR